MSLSREMRDAIFERLKTGLCRHSPPMICSKDKSGTYELIGNIPAPYGSTKKIVPGMYFGSAVARKEMVSFYFMPIYYAKKEFTGVAPNLLKQLKGKACFNFKKEEQIDEGELEALLKKGVKIWRKLKYVR